MNIQQKRIKSQRRNTLLRYRDIVNELDKHDLTEVPISVIYRKYIYPKFFICRNTLYRAINTDVETELKEIEKELQQM